MKWAVRLLVWLAVLAVAACGSDKAGGGDWVDEDVSFVADGLTIHGSYRHVPGAAAAPSVLLISESGQTDRNGDNAVAGKVGNMRQLAEYLSDKKVDSLRYDKVGTGKTGVGPHAQNLRDVGSAVYVPAGTAVEERDKHFSWWSTEDEYRELIEQRASAAADSTSPVPVG